jgi:hypothetical protein
MSSVAPPAQVHKIARLTKTATRVIASLIKVNALKTIPTVTKSHPAPQIQIVTANDTVTTNNAPMHVPLILIVMTAVISLPVAAKSLSMTA